MFQHQCVTSELHPLFTDVPPDSSSKLVHARHVKQSIKEKLCELCHKDVKTVFSRKFCSRCIAYAEQQVTDTPVPSTSSSNPSPPAKKAKTSSYVDSSTHTESVIILSMNSLGADIMGLSNEEKAAIAYELGLSEHDQVRHQTLALSSERELENLMTLSTSQFMSQCNPVLRNFLAGTAGITDADFSQEANENTIRLCMATESAMSLTAQISILPYHFREMVHLYSLTRSRRAVGILCRSGPFGSYQTLKNWLRDLPNKISLDLKGDLLGVFDNNQILQRRWGISVNNSVTCSVITMVIFLAMNEEGDLQNQEDLKPDRWMNKLPNEKRDKVKYIDQDPELCQTRYSHFHKWLSDVIHEVAEEQKKGSTPITDPVDDKIADKIRDKQYKTCPNIQCKFDEVPKRARVCPCCRSKVTGVNVRQEQVATETQPAKKISKEMRVHITKSKDESSYSVKYEPTSLEDTYGPLKDIHPEKPPKVSVAAPVLVNPCSFEAVATVFRAIGKQSGIKRYGGQREWLSIVCDGLPYVLGSHVMKKMFLCLNCNASFMGRLNCERHLCEDHPNFVREFDWVVIQPGPGHLEWNMLKGIVKLFWPIFWEEMVELFNFKSENAKKSAAKVNDFHKGWTLARIARDSMAKELVLPYVRKELRKATSDVLSVANFLKYTMSNVQNPNYAFMLDAIFELLHSLFIYRDGVRSGATNLMDAGRGTLAKLFSARHHPMYRQLEMHDTMMFHCMPKEMQEHIKATMSISLSGVPFSGEGADFKLESVNKDVQHFLPSVPTTADWENACANLAPLQQLRKVIMSDLKLTDQKTTSRTPPDIQEQVLAFRTLIRERGYLADPTKECPHTSIGGNMLDSELVHFCKLAREKRAKYFQVYLDNADNGGSNCTLPFNEPPIFVTKQERLEFEDIANKTVAEIKLRIESLMQTVGDEDLRKFFMDEFRHELLNKKGKKPVKVDFINFFQMLLEFKEQEADFVDTIPNDGYDEETDY